MRNLFLVGFVLLLVIPSVASAADWYVRPTGANFTAGGGTSYANAWKGLENVVFGSGGVQSGDSLYVCGTHIMELMVNRSDQGDITIPSGIDSSHYTVVRGDCQGDPGIVWGSYIPKYGSWEDEGNNTYSISLAGGTHAGMIFEYIDGDYGQLLTRAYSLNETMSTNGSFYSADYVGWSRIYIHRTDNRAPNDNVYLNRYGYEFKIPQGGRYITFQYLTIANMYRWVDSLGSGDDVSYIRWDGCAFRYDEGPMLRTDGSDIHHLDIVNCTFEYGLEGIALNGGSHSNRISGCRIDRMGWLPEHQGGTDPHGIGLMGGTSNNVIEDNHIYQCEDGIVFYAYDGQDARNNTIRRNYIHDLHGLGGHSLGQGIVFGAPGSITLGDTSGNRVYQNVACDGADGLYYKWSDPLEVYNNVFCNNTNNIRVSGTYNDGSGASARIRNTASISPGVNHIEYMTLATEGNYVLDSNNNIFYPDYGNPFHFRDGGGEGYYTSSEWQSLSRTGCTFDTNSLTTHHMFIDADNENFNPLPNSPVIDNGVAVGLTHDIDGTSIPQGPAPDIGIYEYVDINVPIPADVNNDGIVNIFDIVSISPYFGKVSSDPQWSSVADVIADDEIDIFDLVFVASRITQTDISVMFNPSSGTSGTMLVVPVSIDQNPTGITAFGLDMVYDTSMFSFQSVDRGRLTTDWYAVAGNEISPGNVRLGGFAGAANEIVQGSAGSIALISMEVTCSGCSNGQQGQLCIDNYVDHISQLTPMPYCATFTYG